MTETETKNSICRWIEASPVAMETFPTRIHETQSSAPEAFVGMEGPLALQTQPLATL